MASAPRSYQDYHVMFAAPAERYLGTLFAMASLDEAIMLANRLAKAQGFRVVLVRPISQDLPTVQAR